MKDDRFFDSVFFDDRIGQWFEAIQNPELGGLENAKTIKSNLVRCLDKLRNSTLEEYEAWRVEQGWVPMGVSRLGSKGKLNETLCTQLGAVTAALELWNKKED